VTASSSFQTRPIAHVAAEMGISRACASKWVNRHRQFGAVWCVAGPQWARVIAIELAVATVFVLVAAAAVTGPAWLVVAGLTGHGLKDLWQHRTQFVTGTRWWPPFCAAVDWVASTILFVALAVGANLS
jgi:hypothetical protein